MRCGAVQRELSCVWMRCGAACGQGLQMRMHFLLSVPSLLVTIVYHLLVIGGHGTLQKYRGTGTRYFAKISTAVSIPVLSN